MTQTLSTSFTISALALASELDAPDPSLIVLDLRFTPSQDNGHARYLQGHLPGAIFVDLQQQLADPTLRGRGANPLPAPASLQENLRLLGIHADSRIVVYDDRSGSAAARAWWVLRWAGLQDVRILDGGLASWTERGLPLEKGESVASAPGTVTVTVGALASVDVHELLQPDFSDLLIDARSREFYDQGHLPGALNLPASDLLDASGRLLPVAEINARLEALGVDRTRALTTYCGGGVAAAFLIYAWAQTGRHARLYPGSWSEWSADPSRPVERTGALA